MTMHGVLHSKSEIYKVCLGRETKVRGLISCERCIKMEENNLGWYVRNSVNPLIEGMKAAETIECNNLVNKKEFKQMDEEKETMEKQKNLWVVCKRNTRNNR